MTNLMLSKLQEHYSEIEEELAKLPNGTKHETGGSLFTDSWKISKFGRKNMLQLAELPDIFMSELAISSAQLQLLDGCF